MSSSAGSDTQFINRLKAGDRDAIPQIWQRYFTRLAGLTRSRLRGSPRMVASDEDVALSAFNSFFRAVERGRFPDLKNRNDLWQILVMLAFQKIHRLFRSNRLPMADDPNVEELVEQIPCQEATPDEAVAFAEEIERRLAQLDGANLRQVAVWKFEGLSNEQIAAELDCATRTVERKLRSIRTIWERENRT